MSERVYIFDTTLRDGEQSPGASMNTEEKLEIARQLVRLGVDVIEAGFPISSPGDFESVRRLAQRWATPRWSAGYACHRQGHRGGGRRSGRPPSGPASTPVSASRESHLRDKLRISRDEALERAVAAVKHARNFVERRGVLRRGRRPRGARVPVPDDRGRRRRGCHGGQHPGYDRLHIPRGLRRSHRGTDGDRSTASRTSPSRCTATTTSAWLPRTHSQACSRALGRSSARSTASGSVRATRRSKRSSWRSSSAPTSSA